MSMFLSNLKIEALSPDEVHNAGSGVQLYRLLEDFSYLSDVLGVTVTAPAGMITDFASIPRAVWDFMDPEDPIILFPSVIHDYLCRQYGGDGAKGDASGYHFSGHQAAQVLAEAMAVCGASAIKRGLVYDAVARFGPQWD